MGDKFLALLEWGEVRVKQVPAQHESCATE